MKCFALTVKRAQAFKPRTIGDWSVSVFPDFAPRQKQKTDAARIYITEKLIMSIKKYRALVRSY